MLAAEDLPTLAFEKADAFDYHFMAHLMGKLQASTDQAVRAHGFSVCWVVWVVPRVDSVDRMDRTAPSLNLSQTTISQEIDALNKVGEAANFAMQQRLAKADFILRGILKSGDLKVRTCVRMHVYHALHKDRPTMTTHTPPTNPPTR